VVDTSRAHHLCGPPPLKSLPALATGCDPVCKSDVCSPGKADDVSYQAKTDQALPNLASTACILIGMIMMLVTIRPDWHD